MAEPTVVGIELTPLFVPFRETVREAMREGAGGLGMAIGAEEAWDGGDFVVCRVKADSGIQGLGEVMLWLPETGVTTGQVIEVIRDHLGKYVLGRSPFDLEDINRRMDRNVARNEVAKGLLDMACYDLASRAWDLAACEMMGGQQVDEVPLAALIPLMDLDGMTWLARSFCEGGYDTLRIKLGNSVENDVEITRAIREVSSSDTRLRVDYNQAYSPHEAVEAISAIEHFDIDVAEQPVAATDFVGMAYVQKRVETPLMAHEGCFSLGDIRTLAELGGIGVVGLNSERPGGVTRALLAIDFARERDMGVVIHNQTLGIASACQLHIAAARYDLLGHAVELFGDVMFEDDLITVPISYEEGWAVLPEGPGWGVDLDEEALENYSVGPTVALGEK